MVFESIVTDLLNRFLGDFVENLDSKQLQIGIWGGDVVLRDLVLKQTALNDLDLPIQTVYGRLGKLVLKIPWSNLYGASVEAKIEGLYLLVEPNSQVKYNADKEDKRLKDEKKKAIEKYEAAQKLEEEKGKPKGDDTFTEKLVTQIIKNVQLTIDDIHIRYEDALTHPENPFAMGITLHNLTVQTTDANWKATVVEEMVTKIFKIISLEGLSVYWNCSTDLYFKKPRDEFVNLFHSEIATKDFVPEHFKYILGPINLEARLKMNPKPDKDVPAFCIPKIHAELVIEKLAVGITRCQYKDIILFADAMALQSRGIAYRKYRPTHLNGYKGNYKEWWKFAYTCILEEEIKRKKRNWDWSHMLKHRVTCNEYSAAYKTCLKSRKKPDVRLNELEKQLDVFNIVLIRQKIQLEVNKLDADVTKKKATGWFGGWWSKTANEEDKQLESSTNILSQFQAAMTPEEKKKLFQAIGYQENSAPTTHPEEYADNVIKFILNNLSVKIIDDSLMTPDILLAKLNGVKCSIETRSAVSAIKFNVNIDGITTEGIQQDDFLPYLISSSEETSFLDVMFETNPIDKMCGQRINMTVNPLKIIFDSLTVKRCIDVFNIPSSTSLDLLSEVTAIKLNNIKEKSAAGLQYQIDQHTILDVNINFVAPYIIIPHGGIYTESENILLVNLGHLKISTTPRNTSVVDLRDGLEKERKFNEIVSQCYDIFNLELSNVQVVLAQGDEDWKHVIEDETVVSTLHLLRPLNIHITFHKCLISDDPKLPLIKLNGELPLININITDARLLLLLSLISSIQPTFATENNVMGESRKYNSSTIINYLETPKVQVSVPQKRERKYEVTDNFVQFTELLCKFVIREVKVVLSHQEMLSSPIFQEATFQIQQLECELIQQNFNTDIHVNLGRIVLEAYIKDITINIIYTPIIHESEAYLKILFTQVNKHSPEFHSKYHSCESTLKIEFAKLDIKLHLESLKKLLRFVSELQMQLNENEPSGKRGRTSTLQGTLSDMKKKTSSIGKLSRHLSQSSRHLSLNYLGSKKSYPVMGSKTNLIVETIQFKLIAHLSELFIVLETDVSLLSSVAIKNIDSDIIVKTTYTQIGVRLQELTIMDLNKANVHNKIMSVASDEAFNVQIVMYNTEKDKNYIGNPDKVDMSVKVNLGHIRICFINWYISNMMQFLNEFQVAQQAIHEASQAAARAAKDNLQSAYEKATKVSLDINIKAPDIIIPESSKGYQGFLVDLGFITMKNSFKELDIKNEHSVNAVVDQLVLKLENLKITRIELAKQTTYPRILHEISMLKPVTCTLAVNRNLSAWYKSIPDVDISGNLETMELLLGQPDYKCIMRVLNGNLSEGSKQPPPTETLNAETLIQQELSAHGSRRADAGADPDHTHTILRWDFIMKMFKIDLFTVSSTGDVDQYSVNANRIGLGGFSLEGLAIKGRLLSSNTITNAVLLLNCLLIDTRPGREKNLNIILSRKRDDDMEKIECYKDSTLGISRNMFDCTVQQKEGDTFIDVRIYSFNIIISLDYMMKLANFFTELDDKRRTKTAPPPLKKPAAAVKQEPLEGSTSMLTFTLRVEKPDIILVEHMDNISTRALILNTEVMCKFRISGDHQVINGVVKELEMFTCCYDPLQRENTRKTLLEPVTINIAGSSPEGKGLHIEALISEVVLSVSPATIELLSLISNTLTRMRSEEADENRSQEDFSKTWEIQPYKTEDHWFLKPDVAMEAIHYIPKVESVVAKKVLNEKCIVTMPKFTITIEAGVGSKTLPMLLLETTFLAKINDWSSQMYIDANLTMQMAYYNSYLALWEPLIEPVEVMTETGLQTLPWALSLELTKNDTSAEESNPPSIIEDDIQELGISQPAISIDITSKENLEVTITKTFLEVVDNLSKSFASAMKSESEIKQAEEESPYIIRNHTGLLIILSLEKGMFGVAGELKHSEVKLESGAEAKLDLKSNYQVGTRSSILLENTDALQEVENRELFIKVPDVKINIKLPVNRADIRYFQIGPYGLISNIKLEEGVIIINLSSIINVHNNFDIPIDMYYMKHSGNELEYISTIKPGSLAHVPMKAVYSPTSEIFFSVSGYSVTSTPFVWKDLLVNVSVTKNLICLSKSHSEETFVIKAIGELHQVYHENTLKRTMASTIYTINLRPAISLRNYLPYEIILSIQDSAQEFTVDSGKSTQLPTVDPGNCHLIIRMPNYLEKEWVCRHEVPVNLVEFSVWTFESHDSDTKVSLDLGMHVANRNGTSLMCLYCPFWMLNKTGLMLSYRNSDENLNILHHPAQFKGPVLFSFNAKNFFGKKKASVRTETGEWSDKFSVDVAGSSGVVVCKNNNILYQIGVGNRLTYNGLTKQITFTPYFVIINNALVAIECQELDRPGDPWTLIKPKQCTSLWPASLQEDKLIKLRILGTEEVTAPFLITESHTTLLKLKNKYGGINVDTQITEGAIYINLACYEYGSAPAIIINNTKNTMNLWEKETVQIRKLPPNNKMFYTWENPSGQRVLVWEGGYKSEIQDDLRKDGVGEYAIAENKIVYWVSFLDGMQRVLLFTSDPQVAEEAQSSKQFEVIQQEITLSLHGVGLSLVNNVKHKEVMYMGMASTGIIWETCRVNSKRFKQMSTKDNIAIESVYQTYMCQFQSHHKDNIISRYVIENKEYDFQNLEMTKPHKKKIRRTYQTALWVQLKTSSHQMQLHAKLNKLQIDNQIHDCIFPVVLAPVPPPKTIVVGKALKPFAELSIVQLLMQDSQIKQFKYFKVLIQEFHIKVDLGFINAIMEIFQTSEFNDVEESEHFLADTKLVNEPLFSLVSTHSLREQKSFYDLLHFSPLKIHLSFSMAGDGNQEIGNTPNFINVLLQGLGVTLTDLQDVIFKLAFFEREYTFLTQRQLISEATTHYVGQSVKQLYVLVLGLDVIGNPYGLVIGITQGVEDLFYEPFQGAIQGPGEFAEGIVLGVRSLFGHTVGGAAGAVSRITGAMGKGIAALTFDKEYQRKRRDQYNKKPATVQEGFARGSKGLVMGVFDGVTGVFTKPITGAKEQGVEGFFKGLGKGAVGLVTRPTAGVIDFASSSLDTVKRVTEMGHDESNRLRHPRYVQADGLVRPYNKKLAYGNKVLSELEKGKYSSTDSYASHFIIIEKKEVLLLTDKRIAYVEYSDLFGGWQICWAYTWGEISKEPKDVPKGVQIYITSKKKKMFGSNDISKLVLIPDISIRETLISKMNEYITQIEDN